MSSSPASRDGVIATGKTDGTYGWPGPEVVPGRDGPRVATPAAVLQSDATNNACTDSMDVIASAEPTDLRKTPQHIL